jgi:type VI protein secretion system component VasK
MTKMKFSMGNQKQKDLPTIQTVSGTVVFSCYIASVAILVIAVIEAVKRFQLGDLWGGIIYVALAIAGVLFSVFITLWNRRNKKLLKEKKKK